MPKRLPQSVRERFAEARAQGLTIVESSRRAGICDRQGRRWDDDPDMIKLVERLRRSRDERIAAKVAQQVERWLDTEALPTAQLIDLYKAAVLKNEQNITVKRADEESRERVKALTVLSDQELALLKQLRAKVDAGAVEA